jgi:hypothetical protein
MSFLSEGVKVLYRYTYAILKYHKEFIKVHCNDPETLIHELREMGRTETDTAVIKKMAFKYGLKTSYISFNVASIEHFKENEKTTTAQ